MADIGTRGTLMKIPRTRDRSSKARQLDVGVPDSPITRIEPTKGSSFINLRDLWASREVLYFLTWRDIKVRYKQTALGAAWAVIQPFFTMVVFSLFFGRLAKIPSEGVPYPIFSYAALVPWTFFANGLNFSANSLVQNSSLITKVYFNRLTVPVAAVLAVVVDFMIAFVVLLGMMLYYGVTPGPAALLVPLFFLLALVTTLGVGLWLSALNVSYRDIRYTVPFLIQFWLFLTPIAYPSSLLDEPWRTFYGLNPMAGVVEGFRWGLLGVDSPPGPMMAASTITALIVLTTGILYFERKQRSFADVV